MILPSVMDDDSDDVDFTVSTNGAAGARGPPGELEAILKAVAKRWFALCAKQYHPDRCHDDGRCMSVVNNVNETLQKVIDEELKTRRGR
jgi:hypothetical protein